MTFSFLGQSVGGIFLWIGKSVRVTGLGSWLLFELRIRNIYLVTSTCTVFSPVISGENQQRHLIILNKLQIISHGVHVFLPVAWNQLLFTEKNDIYLFEGKSILIWEFKYAPLTLCTNMETLFLQPWLAILSVLVCSMFCVSGCIDLHVMSNCKIQGWL